MIKGELVIVREAVSYSDRFKSRKFVIKVPGEYPQFLECELHQDDVSKVDGLNIGDMVNIEYELRGRVWVNKDGEEKYFNSIKCNKIWKIS